jgi:hypothetical protein
MRKLFRLAAYLLTAYLARVLATRDPRHRVAAKESDTNESRRPIGLRDCRRRDGVCEELVGFFADRLMASSRVLMSRRLW